MYNKFLAEIYFYTEAEGGRKNNIPQTVKYYRPLLFYKMNNYHCQIDLDEIDTIIPGNTYKLRIMIISVCPIRIGDKFELKEIGIIGKGKIISEL